MDNTVALSYIVKMGGTQNKDMIKLSKEIWDYLISQGITITLEYLPSHLNIEADWESRNCQDSSEWKLAPRVFRGMCQKLGQPEIDLFASRLSHQLPAYMAWKPDPGSKATDAFSQSWHRLFPYAFPPFCLIGRVLTKVRNEKCTLMLVAPVWQTQHWYPLLLEMSIRNPVLLPQHRDLLKDPSGKNHPLTQKRSIHLAVWLVSGHTYLQRAYHRKLQNLSLNLEGLEHYHIMTRPGKSGFAGVMNGSLIPFDVL